MAGRKTGRKMGGRKMKVAAVGRTQGETMRGLAAVFSSGLQPLLGLRSECGGGAKGGSHLWKGGRGGGGKKGRGKTGGKRGGGKWKVVVLGGAGGEREGGRGGESVTG